MKKSEDILQKQLSQTLPDEAMELLQLFHKSNNIDIRINCLSKIKGQIVNGKNKEVNKSFISQAEFVFSSSLTNFFRNNDITKIRQAFQVRLFFHVISLAIKYYFEEKAFIFLQMNLRQSFDNQSVEANLMLDFSRELIQTIQTQQNIDEKKCKFQKYFTYKYLNQMLYKANFILNRATVPYGRNLQQNYENSFHMKGSQIDILSAIKLIRVILCYDWMNDRQNEQEMDYLPLIIPTKGYKLNSLQQFQKWLANSEWLKLYQFLIKKCLDYEIKKETVGLLGDLSRIQMKYFKTKVSYKTHIQNIVYSMTNIIDQLQLSKNSEQNILFAKQVMYNLSKLLNPGTLSMLFEININFIIGIFDCIRKFIIDQVVGEEIMNSDLIFFVFKFIANVIQRGRISNKAKLIQDLQLPVREICFSYEQYIRNMLTQSSKKNKNNTQRYNINTLQKCIQDYNINEIMIFLYPFRLVKPRYQRKGCQNYFITITSKIIRALSIVQLLKLQEWQLTISTEMILMSIQELQQWINFLIQNEKNNNSVSNSEFDQNNIASITQMVFEQIQNQQQHYHYIKTTLFVIIECLLQKNILTLFKLQRNDLFYKLIRIVVSFSLNKDFQNETIENRLIIESYIKKCYEFCFLLQLNQFQNKLKNYNKYTKKQYEYTFHFFNYNRNTRYYQKSRKQLLNTIYLFNINKNTHIFKYLNKIQIIMNLDDPNLFNRNSISFKNIYNYFQTVLQNQIIKVLLWINFSQNTIFLQRVEYLRNQQPTQETFLDKIGCLRLLVLLQIPQISEQAFNKLFMYMKYVINNMVYFDSQSQLQQQFQQIITQVLSRYHQQDTDILKEQMIKYIQTIKNKQKIDIQIQQIQQLTPQEQQSSNQNKCKSTIQPMIQKSIQKSQKRYSQNLYNGYHRQKTLSVVNKYIFSSPIKILETAEESFFTNTNHLIQKIKSNQQKQLNLITISANNDNYFSSEKKKYLQNMEKRYSERKQTKIEKIGEDLDSTVYQTQQVSQGYNNLSEQVKAIIIDEQKQVKNQIFSTKKQNNQQLITQKKISIKKQRKSQNLSQQKLTQQYDF